jgi:ABC-type dipeptide/oligopeptide/nickel transport system permease subunit
LGGIARLPWPALLALGVMLLALGLALTGPLLPVDPFAQELMARNQPPDADYWLGTDHLGRSVAARLLRGTTLSLGIGLAATALALTLGGGLGLIATALGRWPDYLVFGLVDLIRTLPGVLLALVLVVTLGSGVWPVTAALGITFAPHYARVARAVYQREAAADYVAYARSQAADTWHLLRRHILPNVAGALVTQTVIILPRAIVTESVLSFLGVGVAPDTPTWGRMIAQASRYVETAPHAVLIPVLALSLLTLSLAILGEWLRRRLDPLRHGAGRPP